MRAPLRVVAIAVALLAIASRPASARPSFVIVTGDDFESIREISIETATALFTFTDERNLPTDRVPTTLGYHYQRVALLFADLWRSDGEFVLYQGDSYWALTDYELAELGGAEVPVRYYLPPGFLALFAVGELVVISLRQRKVWLLLAIGVLLLLVTVVLLVMFRGQSLVVEQFVPAIVGAYHLAIALTAMRAQSKADAAEAADAAAAAAAARGAGAPMRAPDEQPLPPAPTFETDPFRGSPRAPIVVVQPSSTRAASAPIVFDEASEKPKLLT